jgi:hypothetical protein
MTANLSDMSIVEVPSNPSIIISTMIGTDSPTLRKLVPDIA